MTILKEESLDFAREHIHKYYDSDFYPKPMEFEALWHHWDDVKKELMSKNVAKIWVTPPRTMTVSKPKGGFRVVHQLEPLDAIIYTALACEISAAVEAARMDAGEKIACSYRLAIADGSFFAGGSGWADFRAKTEELAAEFDYLLTTDITDFYNQIYLHRLNNAIESADANLKPVSDDIEIFLSTLNNKASQGVPVGPAASVVMAEAVLIDVDSFLQQQGIKHTRYVDDIRIFANTSRELHAVLERLTLYLYENHRLTISSEKTAILKSNDFVKNYLHNTYADEKVRLLQTLEIFNPYTEEVEQYELEVEADESEQREHLIDAISQIVAYEHLDLGLARSVIRTARRNSVPDIALYLIQNFEFFSPAVNDVAIYLQEVTDPALAEGLRMALENLVDSSALDSQLSRFWMEWYVAHHLVFMQSEKLRHFVFDGRNVENMAIAAITTRNVAWVRNQKANVYNLGGWARRAVLNASRVLPSDERTHWLRLFIGNSPVILDRWVAKWVLDTN